MVARHKQMGAVLTDLTWTSPNFVPIYAIAAAQQLDNFDLLLSRAAVIAIYRAATNRATAEETYAMLNEEGHAILSAVLDALGRDLRDQGEGPE